MRIKKIIPLLILVVFIISATQLDAQCAMCKQVVDSGAKSGSTVAKGLNTGILYLLLVPFLAIATFSIAFLRRVKMHQK